MVFHRRKAGAETGDFDPQQKFASHLETEILRYKSPCRGGNWTSEVEGTTEVWAKAGTGVKCHKQTSHHHRPSTFMRRKFEQQ
jgi:hypothetical protein